MTCKKCFLSMRLQPGTIVWECTQGHKFWDHSLESDDEVETKPQTVIVEIPYEKPQPSKDSAYKKRVEKKLKERKAWLSNNVINEEDITVQPDGKETFTLSGVDGGTVTHTVPTQITRAVCFGRPGHFDTSFKKSRSTRRNGTAT